MKDVDVGHRSREELSGLTATAQQVPRGDELKKGTYMDAQDDSMPPPEQTPTEASPPDGSATRSVAVCTSSYLTADDLAKADLLSLDRAMKPKNLAAALYHFFGRSKCRSVANHLAAVFGDAPVKRSARRRAGRRGGDAVFGDMLG